MSDAKMPSWIEISRERLGDNFRVVTAAAESETDVLAVVKANAYGHGADLCAVELARAGARWLGVGTASEGAQVRAALDAAGLVDEQAPDILLMCGMLPDDVPAIVDARLVPVIWTSQQVGWLAGTGVRAHIEVETGMGRQGVHPGTALDTLLDAMRAAELTLDGVLTHFCAAEYANHTLTIAQQSRFETALAQVRQRGFQPAWVHAGSSSSIDNPPHVPGAAWLAELAESIGARSMLRCGIALYGYCLPITGGNIPSSKLTSAPAGAISPALKPVMTWKTRVIDVRHAAAGETFGYNARYSALHPMRVALLPVGYADGLRRELSSTNSHAGGWVMIPGRDGVSRRAPILGRVSMNLTTVDVTEIDDIRVGDEVVLLGDHVTADDHARLAQTISYEILCGVRAQASPQASTQSKKHAEGTNPAGAGAST